MFKIVNSTGQAWPSDARILCDSATLMNLKNIAISLNAYRIAFLTIVITVPETWSLKTTQHIKFFVYSESQQRQIGAFMEIRLRLENNLQF